MRIIARRTLRDFVQWRVGHKDRPALKAALDAWFDEVRKTRWTQHGRCEAAIRHRERRVGRSDRVQYQRQRLSARGLRGFREGNRVDQWIGSHREYDSIDVKGVQHGRP